MPEYIKIFERLPECGVLKLRLHAEKKEYKIIEKKNQPKQLFSLSLAEMLLAVLI